MSCLPVSVLVLLSTSSCSRYAICNYPPNRGLHGKSGHGSKHQKIQIPIGCRDSYRPLCRWRGDLSSQGSISPCSAPFPLA